MGNEGESGNKINLNTTFTVTVDAGTVAADHLNTISGKTTGLVTATDASTITGTAAAINTLVGDEGDSGDKVNLDGDFLVTIAAGTASAAHLNTINAETTGLVTATAVTELTGTAAAINTLVGNEGDAGDKVNLDTDYTATITDTNLSATVLNNLNSNVPGLVAVSYTHLRAHET